MLCGLTSPENLEGLARLLDAGTLKVPSRKTYELDRAGEALQALATTHTQASSPFAATLNAVKMSAGLVLFRKREGTLQMLLGHMGGPYWTRKDEGAWSIPKGELSEGEDALAGALREYTEELGLAPPDGPVLELGEIRQRAGKRLVAFAVEGDFDPAQLNPGTFELEWPPHSGRRQAFPEIDRVAWFDLATAKRKIVQGQAGLLDRLAGRHPSGDGSSEKFT